MVRAARLMLAGFALALAAAALAPLAQARAMRLVCSADGQVRLVHAGGDAGGAAGGVHALDCALCLPAAPPAGRRAQPLPHLAAGPVPLLLPPPAHVALQVGAPLPPRGPPVCC